MRTLGLSGDAAHPLATDASYFALLVLVIIAFVAVLALRRHRPERPGRQIRIRVWVAAAASLSMGWLLFWPEGLEEFASVVLSSLRPEVAVLVMLGFYASFLASSVAASRSGRRPRDAFIGALLLFYGVVLLGLLSNYG